MIEHQSATLPDLFSALAYIDAVLADHEQGIAKTKQTRDELRTQIEQTMRDNGAKSVSDSESGYSATFKTTRRFKITTPELLHDHLRSIERYDEFTYTAIDDDAILRVAKGGEVWPGIEELVAETFAVTKPKVATP